jgi:hypothetical protein
VHFLCRHGPDLDVAVPVFPLAVWSMFNSLLNLPLVVAMYLGEYAWRLWRFPDYPHASIATVLRACRNFEFKRPAAGR